MINRKQEAVTAVYRQKKIKNLKQQVSKANVWRQFDDHIMV